MTQLSDILKVTTPPSGYENSTKTNPITTNDTNIQNIVDPTKVVRPDGQAGSQESNNNGNGFTLNYESNFDKFMQLVRNSPPLVNVFSQMMFTGMGNIISSGINENFAQEISQFMEMIKMSDEQLLDFVKAQSSSSVRFKGTFFNVLRQVFTGSDSIELKGSILDFLKRYNDMASSEHIINNMDRTLADIAERLPKTYRETFIQLIDKLITQKSVTESVIKQGNASQTDIDSAMAFDSKVNQQNTLILKREIIPLLGNYIARSHDLGKIRDLITKLTLDITRYENGNTEGFMLAFKNLLGYSSFRDKLGSITEKQIINVLLNTEFEKASEGSGIMDKLSSIIEKGMSGEAGHETKAVFQNIVNSFLINQSVYMPLLHMVIPAEVNGGLFFSEMWIDPDAENKNEGSNGGERKIKLLIKFDIKDVGFFDMVILSEDQKVDLQLYYPEKLMSMEKEIKSGISSIMEKNNLIFRSFLLEKCVKPKTISEIFPKIYERKNSINVKI